MKYISKVLLVFIFFISLITCAEKNSQSSSESGNSQGSAPDSYDSGDFKDAPKTEEPTSEESPPTEDKAESSNSSEKQQSPDDTLCSPKLSEEDIASKEEAQELLLWENAIRSLNEERVRAKADAKESQTEDASCMQVAILQVTVNHAATKAEDIETAECVAKSVNELLAQSPFLIDLSSRESQDSKITLVSEFSKETLSAKSGATMPENNESMAMRLHNAGFGSTNKYGPRSVEGSPQISLNSGQDIQNFMQSDQGRYYIQQGKNVLQHDKAVLDALKNQDQLQEKYHKVITRYGIEIENKSVKDIVVSSKDIHKTHAQLQQERDEIQKELALKEKEWEKLLSGYKLTEDEFGKSKAYLINCPEGISLRSFGNLTVAMKINPVQKQVAEIQARLYENETRIRLVRECERINNQHLEKMALSFFEKNIVTLSKLNLTDCKKLLNELEEYNLRLIKENKDLLASEQKHQRKIKELTEKLNSSKSHKHELMIEIGKRERLALSDRIARQKVKILHKGATKTLVAGPEIIEKKIQEINRLEALRLEEIKRLHALQLYEKMLEERDLDSYFTHAHKDDLAMLYAVAERDDLYGSLSKTVRDGAAVSTVSYSLHQKTKNSLADLGFDHQRINLEFRGDRVQHEVHSQLIASLDKMATIKPSNAEVQSLLKTAVTINLVGQDLNGKHKITHALAAKEACDSIIEFAKSIADLGLAIGQGVVDGYQLLGTLGKEAADAITFPERTIEQVRTTFNGAVLSLGKFFSSVHKDYELIHKDSKSFNEFINRAEERDKKVIAFFETLAQKYHETPLRDKVRAASKFCTECVLLGEVGGIFFEELTVFADMIKLEGEIAGATIQEILVKPQQALAREVLTLTIQTVDKDAALVEGAIKFIQQDAETIAKINRAETSIGKEITTIIENSGKDTIRLEKFSSQVMDEAVKFATTPAKIAHIFKKAEHKLTPLVAKLGGYEEVTRAILHAAQGKLPAAGVFIDIPVEVAGFTVCIRGAVIDGIPKLGTFFIK